MQSKLLNCGILLVGILLGGYIYDMLYQANAMHFYGHEFCFEPTIG